MKTILGTLESFFTVKVRAFFVIGSFLVLLSPRAGAAALPLTQPYSVTDWTDPSITLSPDTLAPGNVIHGIAAWWRVDIGFSSSSLQDYTGNGHTLTQPAVVTQGAVPPVWYPAAINFNPGINIYGPSNNSACMAAPSVFGTGSMDNMTLFTVITSSARATDLLWNEGQYRAQIPYLSQGAIYYYVPGGSWTPNWPGVYGQPYLYTFDRQPSLMSISMNNKSLGSSFAISGNAGNNSPFLLGAVGQGNGLDGAVAEMIVYSNTTSMTATQRQQIMSYLALKYGITLNPAAPVDYLASDGTPFWGAAANSGYYRGITGIGRDDGSALNQKQSLSLDTGFVTLSLGTGVAFSNVSNAGTIPADKSFLVFGGDIGTGTTLLTRTWKVQKTNWTDQSITLSTDPSQPAPLYFNGSTDPAFSTGNTNLPMTGRSITLNSSQLPDGSYFRFATVPLPLQFLSFDVRESASNMLLTWKTADEENVKGFYVQRSGNGRDWGSLGFVATLGGSGNNSYGYTDAAPAVGDNYYRIAEQDLDGRLLYSLTRLAPFNVNGFSATIYPVPATSTVTIITRSPVEEPAMLRVTDLQGRTIGLQKMSLLKGNSTQVTLDITKYAAGTYILEIKSSSVTWTGQFNKQ